MPQKGLELEAATRRRRIDPRLKAGGWQVKPFLHRFADARPVASAVEERPIAAGPADYALTDDGTVRGVVEAKKVTIGQQGCSPKLSATPAVSRPRP